ncbi:hypothetical protein HCH_05153 [Hahella chejuensis KCTC 2396]|uniref:Uncharacterized protein n=1 Tax=Hahella chejuensis (strain KCTC 2396) TaxID=349521 RepID=Q2SBZ1_HAHCH|nr:hypothetical protein HCH_05153 [Hahella chejuensis KCTC 2396]
MLIMIPVDGVEPGESIFKLWTDKTNQWNGDR